MLKVSKGYCFLGPRVALVPTALQICCQYVPCIQDSQPDDISEADLLALVDKYNNMPEIHGILVQLPLPKHINEEKVR